MTKTPPAQDEDIDYGGYNIPNTSRVDEISFTTPGTKKTTSTLQLRQEVKQDKLTALYKHLNITDDLDLINLDRFKLTTDPKKGATVIEFKNGRNN